MALISCMHPVNLNAFHACMTVTWTWTYTQSPKRAAAAAGADKHMVRKAGQEVATQETAAAAGGEEAQPVETADKEELSVPPKQAPALATVKEEHAPNSPTAGGKANCACCIVA